MSDNPTTGLRQVGDRLECAACGEVVIWCQCEPSPFNDSHHAAMHDAIERDRKER